MRQLNPLVSIIIPVYNGANYMQEAIDSALLQTYKNIEIIVINDGSRDNGATHEIALSYGNKIRYIHKENGGVATALNMGIKEMKGEYFSWLSHDDAYLPEKIQSQIDFFNNNNNSNIILYGGFYYIDSKSKIVKEVNLHLDNPNEFILRHLLLDTLMNGCTALIKRSIFDDIGLFNPELRSTQDYDMWFRMAQKYQFMCMNKPLIFSRVHEEQATNIPKPILYKEVNDIYINMLTNISQKDIAAIGQFKHQLFFYNMVIRSFEGEVPMWKLLRKQKYYYTKA